MEGDGDIKPNLVSNEILIDVLCKDGKPHDAIDVLNLLRSKGLSPCKRTYNMIIGSLCREGFEEEGKCLFKEMVENDVPDKREAYYVVERHEDMLLKFMGETVIEQNGRKNKEDDGICFFKRDNELDPETFNNLIRRVVSNNRVDEAAELTSKPYKPDHVMIRTVIDGLHESGQGHHVSHLLVLLNQTNEKVYDYWVAIQGSCENKMVIAALQLLYEMILKDISPKMPTIYGVYHVVGESEGYEGLYHTKYLKEVALKVLEEAFDKDIVLSSNLFVEMICYNGWELSENWESYFDDSFVCDFVINGYGFLGHIDKAIEVFVSLVDMGHKPSIISYNAMLYALFHEGRFDEGWKIFEKMEIQPVLDTYVILIYGLCKNRLIAEVFSFIGKMEKNEGIRLNLNSYEKLVDILCKDGKPDVARDVLNQLHSKNLSPKIVTYNKIIGSLCRDGFADDGKCLVKEMVENGAVTT